MSDRVRVQPSDSSFLWFMKDEPAASAAGKRLFEEAGQSVVKIHNGLATGTGFIGPDGRVVTAYHVIKGATELFAVAQDGKRYKLGGRVSIDDTADLAALEFVDGAPNLPRLQLDKATPAPGTTVRTLGHPSGFSLYLSEGSMLKQLSLIDYAKSQNKAPDLSFSNPADLADYEKFLNGRWMVSQIAARKGNSGGPIFGPSAGVLSVCSMGGEGNLLAASPERLASFLNRKPSDEPFINQGGFENGFSTYMTSWSRQPITTGMESALPVFGAYGLKRLTPKSGTTIRTCATILAAPYLGYQTYSDVAGLLRSSSSLDTWKFGLATTADTVMVAGWAGALLTRVPKVNAACRIAVAAGAASRLATEFIPNHYVLDVKRPNGDPRPPFLDHLITFPLSTR